MAVFNGRIAELGAAALSRGGSIPVIVEFAETGQAALKIGDTVGGRVEVNCSAYHLRFTYRG